MKKVLTSLGTLGAAVILVAGCGGGSGSSSSGASTSASTSGSGRPGGAQFQKYTKCLSKHGVDLPQRNGGNGGPPNGGSFPEGAPPNGGSIPNGGSLPEGVTPPSGSGSGAGFPGLDQSDPTVKKALDACASLRPSFGGGNGFPGAPDGSGDTGGGQTNGSATNGQST